MKNAPQNLQALNLRRRSYPLFVACRSMSISKEFSQDVKMDKVERLTNVIKAFLKKQDMAGLNINNHPANIMASGIALELSEYLNMKGKKIVLGSDP